MMFSPNTNLEQLQSITKLHRNDITPVWEKNWILSYSGGADSTLALHVLLYIHRIHPLKNRTLIVYFLDHGDQTQQEMNVRTKLMTESLNEVSNKHPDLKIEIVIRYRNMKSIARKIKQNFENTSARLRRKQIEILHRKHSNSIAVTGHNMSDWLETLIMRMNRGAGIEKLYPFLPTENIHSITYFRPLTLLTTHEIRQYCNSNNLKYWNDPSNFNDGNMRSRLRRSGTNELIYNAHGFRLTAENFFKLKKSAMQAQNLFLDKMLPNLLIISPEREYRIKFEFFLSLEIDERNRLVEYIASNLQLWPLSATVRTAMLTTPFYYKGFSIEKENWGNTIYLVFRKGKNNFRNAMNPQKSTVRDNLLNGDAVTKKHFIKLSYGRKSIKKIFSEMQLSGRQRKNLSLTINPENNFEVLFMPLSIYELRDIFSINSQDV